MRHFLFILLLLNLALCGCQEPNNGMVSASQLPQPARVTICLTKYQNDGWVSWGQIDILSSGHYSYRSFDPSLTTRTESGELPDWITRPLFTRFPLLPGQSVSIEYCVDSPASDPERAVARSFYYVVLNLRTEQEVEQVEPP